MVPGALPVYAGTDSAGDGGSGVRARFPARFPAAAAFSDLRTPLTATFCRILSQFMTNDRTAVEAALVQPRASLVAVLVALPLACWIWVIAMARDMYGPMSGASAWMMTVAWDAPRLFLLWAMWAAMMAGMMLPTIAPMLLLYGGAMRQREGLRHPSLRIYALAAGYLAVWFLFSIGATALQRVLASWSLLTMMMEPQHDRAAAALLLIAGVYQLTPLKQACLIACRSPITLLSSGW